MILKKEGAHRGLGPKTKDRLRPRHYAVPGVTDQSQQNLVAGQEVDHPRYPNTLHASFKNTLCIYLSGTGVCSTLKSISRVTIRSVVVVEFAHY